MTPRILFPTKLPSFYVTQNKRNRDISNDYILQSTQLGEPGQFGKAYVCIRRTDRYACAVKVIDKTRFVGTGNMKRIFEGFRSEIAVMQKLYHPNIVEFYDVYENADELMLVMELCCGGELYDRIAEKAGKGGYNEEIAANILKQILSAVACMHSHNICHCDLKPANILFSTKSERAQVKVIDFGFAQRAPKWMRYLGKRCGTLFYMAPEIIEGKYNKEADLWSIGVIMFAMFMGYTPFQSVQDDKLSKREQDIAIANRISKGFRGFPKRVSISNEAAHLIQRLLETDVRKRYTARQALMHPWFENASPDREIPLSVLEQLQQVSEMDNFKVMVVSAFRNDLDLTMTSQLKKYFEKFDKNQDKRISLREFEDGLNTFWPQLKVQNIRELFHHLDIDGDNYIQLDEFMSLIAYQHLVNAYDRLKQIFEKLDVNQDGYLDKADLPKLKQAIDDDPLIRRLKIDPYVVLQSADVDNDGRVSFDEFLYAMHPELIEPKKRNDLKSLKGSKVSSSERSRGRPLSKSGSRLKSYQRLDTFDVVLDNVLTSSGSPNFASSTLLNNAAKNRMSRSDVHKKYRKSFKQIQSNLSNYSISKPESIAIEIGSSDKPSGKPRRKKRGWFSCSSRSNY